MKTRKLLALILTVVILAGMVPSVYAAEPISGTVQYYSTAKLGETLETAEDTYTYSDGWFSEDPAVRNDKLALVSMQLTAAAIDGDPDGLGTAFLKELGFENTGLSDFASTDPTDCNYTWGTKELDDGTALVAVVIQSYAFDQATKIKGWQQNFTVNGETECDEHFAYALAVSRVIDDIAALGGDGPVKYWITGYSRGGALANLLAVKLPALLADRNTGIYAYTFEAPATVNGDAALEAPYIHNYICEDDPVVHIPVWGMTRHGADYVLKAAEGTEADAVSGALMSVIPTRAAYSEEQTETLSAGLISVDVSYNFQETFVKLMTVIFESSTDPLGFANEFIAQMGALPTEISLATWNAVQETYASLNQTGDEDFPLTLSDLYALGKLLTPFSGMMGMTSMHSFDVEIALLKELAAAQEAAEPAAAEPAEEEPVKEEAAIEEPAAEEPAIEEEAAQEEEPKAAIVPIYGFSRPFGLGRFCFFIPTKDAKGLS